MSHNYRIVRVHANMTNLEVVVGEFLAEGWQVQGSPFFDNDSRQWCQAMIKPKDAAEGQVRLREPKRR